MDGEQGIRVSNKERSSDQIVKPINVEALTQWVGTFPEDLVAEMADVAPMLSKAVPSTDHLSHEVLA
jgi:protein-tyrosine sulfotransferase